MKLRIAFLQVLMLFSVNIALSQEPDWLAKMKSIKPLFSTRDDAIKMFGQPLNKEKKYIEYYELDIGRMSILYSTGICVKKLENGVEKVYNWNVPKWTIVDIDLRLKKGVSPKKLGVNFVNFISEEIGDVPGVTIYRSDELGIDYTVNKGKIKGISFQPSERYDYLLCK